MKRTKKPVVKEEVVSVEITQEEFAEIAARECAKALQDACDCDEGNIEFAITLSLAFAEFSANLMHRIFDEPEESEEEAEG